MIRWAFLIGNIGYICCLRVTGMWLMPYISPAQDPNLFFKDLTLVGTALALSQILNAFLDPFLGKYISIIKKRFLFQIFSVISFSFFSLIPFSPIYTYTNDWANMLLLSVLLIVNLLCCSLYQTCFLSLIPVFSKTDEDRCLYSTYVTYGMIIGGALALGMSGFVVEALGIQHTIYLFVRVGLIFMLGSTFMLPLKEVIPSNKSSEKFFDDFIMVFKNSYFITAIICILAANSVYTYFTFMAPYLTEVIVKQPHRFTSYAVGISVVFATISTPFAAKRIKAVGTMSWMLATLIIFTTSILLIGSMGFFSSSMLQLVFYIGGCIVCGIGIGQSLVISYVLIAESVQRESKGNATAPIYHSFYNLFLKITTGVITFLISLLFEYLGSGMQNSNGIKLSFLVPLICVLFAIFYLIIKKKNYKYST